MVKETAELFNLSKIRHDVVESIRDRGGNLSPEMEDKVKLVVGEATANIVLHGECSELGYDVAILPDKLVVIFEADCYKNPKVTRRWFDKKSYADDVSETGRGCPIMLDQSNVQVRKGKVEFWFDLPVADKVRDLELAVAF